MHHCTRQCIAQNIGSFKSYHLFFSDAARAILDPSASSKTPVTTTLHSVGTTVRARWCWNTKWVPLQNPQMRTLSVSVCMTRKEADARSRPIAPMSLIVSMPRVVMFWTAGNNIVSVKQEYLAKSEAIHQVTSFCSVVLSFSDFFALKNQKLRGPVFIKQENKKAHN